MQRKRLKKSKNKKIYKKGLRLNAKNVHNKPSRGGIRL